MRRRDEVEQELRKRKPAYVILARVMAGYGLVDGVPCKVYLPRRAEEQPYLAMHPTQEQSHLLGASHRWRIEAELASGSHLIRLNAREVYSSGLTTTHWGPNVVECFALGEPWDLEIVVHRGADSRGSRTLDGVFLLTPNSLLTPALIIMRSYTGEVKVETVREVKLNLPSGPELTFKEHFRHEESKEGYLSFSELVAEFCEAVELSRFPEVLQSLDDLLLIASLADRHRCVCLGWKIRTDTEALIDFYRRGIVMPPKRQDRTPSDTLIEMSLFEEFLATAYSHYLSTRPRGALRQAINLCLFAEGRTIEALFLTRYYALEALVRVFRRGEAFVRNGTTTDSSRKKSQLGFVEGFQKLCESYSVDLSDLWPVVERTGGVSLADVRNKLVHGEVFTPIQEQAIFSAALHLQWALERILLGILGWPPEKSLVSARALGFMVPYREWPQDRAQLSS